MQQYQPPPAQAEKKKATKPQNLEPVLEDSVEATADGEAAEIHTLVRYDVTDEQLATLAKECSPLVAFDADYDDRRKAIATCRDLRVAVESTRVRLKRGALVFGRKVDATAKHYTALLEAIEEPMKLTKGAIDDEKERVKREKAEAEKAALEAKVRAEREAEESRLRAEREAEEKSLAEERNRLALERAELAEKQRRADEAARAERERVEAEQRARQAELDAEASRLKAEREKQAEAARVEREKLEAERRAVAAERDRQERAEFERQAKIKAEAEAKERAERERVAAEEARVREAERQAEQARRLEALKPDREKVHAFAATIRALKTPLVESEEAAMFVAEAMRGLELVANELETFGQPETEESF